MAIVVTQPAGAGTAVGRTLENAWASTAIVIAAPEAHKTRHTMADASNGALPVIVDADEPVCNFTPAAGRASYRIRTQQWAYEGADPVSSYVVVRVSKDAAGTPLPGIERVCLSELPGEANDDRGRAAVEDRNALVIESILESPWKPAVVAISTENITLSGLQTLHGVSVGGGDRVLVNGQTDRTENGIYIASEFGWIRASDMAGASSLLGTTVRVLGADSDLAGWWTLNEPTSGPIAIGTTEIEFALLGGFVVPEPEAPWTPADISGAFFWALGIADAALRTMSGANVVLTLSNGIANGLIMTATGTPSINSTNLLHGHPSLVLGSTHELACASGGPVGNQAHWMIILTDGDVTTSESLMRCGTRNVSGAAAPSTTSSVGILSNPFFHAADPANDFVPYASGAGVPVPNGSPRIIGGHYLPTYSKKIVRIDGYTPQADSNFQTTETYNLDGSFAFGRHTNGAANSNASRIRDAVWGVGEIDPGDYARLCAYWQAKFSLSKLAPRILYVGDSITFGTGASNAATTSWRALLTARLNAQLTIDARENLVESNISLAGKYLGGSWALQGSLSPTMAYQADGQYVSWVDATNQGLPYTAPFSRSGRRRYELAVVMGGTNDCLSGGATGAQLIARAQYICAKLRDAGYYVVLCTIIPGNPGTWSGAFEPHRIVFNAWVLASSVSDGYAHAAINSEAGGLVYSVGNFADALHPNDTGHDLIADGAFTTVYALLQSIPEAA